MKKILPILIGILGMAGSVYALPTTSYQQNVYPFLTSAYDLGTSTKAWSGGTFNKLCLTADSCITTWPTGGAGGGIPWPFTKYGSDQATSTTIDFFNGLLSTASSTFTGSTTLATTLFTNGTSTNFAISSLKDILLMVGQNGSIQGTTTIGANQIQTPTISGITLGSNLNAHTHDTSLTGTSYNGSAAVSNWGLDLTHPNVWTGLQTFSNASSTLFSSTIASTSQFILSGAATGCATFTSGLLSSTGVACGSGGGLPYPFPTPTNGTTSLVGFFGGLNSTASSTIGGGTVATGLVINGGATSTSDFLHLGSTTLQAFTATKGTITSGTSTDWYPTNLNVNGSTTLQAFTAFKGTTQSATSTNAYWTNALALGSTTLQAFTAFQGTITSATSTNDYPTNLLVSGSTTLQSVFATNSTTTNATTSKMAFYNNDTSPMWVMKDFGSYLAFATTSNVNSVNSGATTSVDAVDFQSSGVGMGVGTTTLNNSYMVVAYQGTTGNIFTVANATATPFYVTSNGAAYAPNTTTSGSSQTGYWCYDAGGQLIRDTAVCLVSALRFKKDVTPIDVGLSDLMKLRPVNYYYKDASFGANRMMGFIADEVASSSPKLNEELVTYDKTGLIHGFNYETFTALLAKSIQDFYGQFQTLIARVSGLENKVNAQQAEIDALNARLNKLEK